MIRSAKKCGANSVKLQILTPELISSTPWIIDAQKKAQLTYDEYLEIKKFAEKMDIEIFSSIGDIESFQLFKRLKFKKVKISSSNLNNFQLHEKICDLECPVILSTGDARLSEIKRTVDFYKTKNIDISVTHCIPKYPTKLENTYLKTIPYLKKTFNIPIGFSDHTRGVLASIVAVALGATIIEKHFTIDNNMPGPDHHFSLNPDEFSLLVDRIRETEKTLGNPDEYFKNINKKKESNVRRAIVFIKNKKAGYKIKLEDVIIARPKKHSKNEIDPFDYKEVIGKKLKKNINAFEPIEFDHI